MVNIGVDIRFLERSYFVKPKKASIAQEAYLGYSESSLSAASYDKENKTQPKKVARISSVVKELKFLKTDIRPGILYIYNVCLASFPGPS